MCICINCKYIHQCLTYRLIAQQHQHFIISSIHSFYPHNVILQVGCDNQYNIEWDIIECMSFTDEPGQWIDTTQ